MNRVAFILPILQIEILWYGILFATGCFLSFLWSKHLLKNYFDVDCGKLLDHFFLSIVVGSIIGARIAHILFYSSIDTYLDHPMRIFLLREGGLSSHGGIVGGIVALLVFSYRIRKKYRLHIANIFDVCCFSVLIAATCIRIGNFINGELYGTETSFFLSVSHPFLKGVTVHPVQLYESIAYFFIWCFLIVLQKRGDILKVRWLTTGLFLSIVFSARYMCEFFKAPQTNLRDILQSNVSMGQLLSLPCILIGCVVIYISIYNHKK